MIDWARVRQLRNDVGAGEFLPLVTLFLDEIEARLDRLDPASGQLSQDVQALRRSALNLGFMRLAALCLSAEISLRNGRPELIRPDELSSSFGAARQALRREMSEQLADPP